ncbi:P-loop containing nucleoside triphosphate hydrolase protein [Ceraceosorus guamensis]|uniref:P-loop containing nucleoside triphosphate hydrolase protein n=1 Tax=Ceraceosorus guamensis TaxID=1522189 RepID=A0A316W5L7_9BASI|nr:P-loop containing nucleoside triphosphate hydrolase protein [Ceraceosorus guamensis]PWN45139.1 P-loop containing nucleoside triphosphate hydrolase protein [Ceraceosorus guamensis]
MSAATSTAGPATSGSASATPAPDPKIARRLQNVKNLIIVLSGKGGVGKSSVTSQLALSLASQSDPITGLRNKVGVLDVDLTGPSIPRMLGLDGQAVRQSSDGWVPVYADREQSLAVMSVGFLLRSKNDSVVWRGPKKNAMIKQFLGDVRWGPLDYLILDTPPGTSDEHISLLEYLHHFNPSAIMVTTPQALSLADNLRSLDFTKKVNLPLLGLVENMSGYVCPHCTECTNVWGKGGGEALAGREGLRFLGRIPIDPGLVRVLDDAKEEATKAVHEAKMGPMAPTFNDPSSGNSIAKEVENLQLTKEDAQAQAESTSSITRPLAPLSNVAPPAIAAESSTPAGTALSRTIIQRYRDSATFPIFQIITSKIIQAAAEHAHQRTAGYP